MDFLTLYEFILDRLPESLDLEWLAFGIAASTLAFLVFNAVI